MISMSIPVGTGEPRHQHIRTEGTNHANQVGESRIVSTPLVKCLVRALRESKVRDARKALLHSVVLIGREQFLGTQHAQHV